MGISSPIDKAQAADRRQSRDRRYSNAQPWFPFVDRHGIVVQSERRQSAGRRTHDHKKWRKRGNLVSMAIIVTMFAVLSWGALAFWTYENTHSIQMASDATASKQAQSP